MRTPVVLLCSLLIMLSISLFAQQAESGQSTPSATSNRADTQSQESRNPTSSADSQMLGCGGSGVQGTLSVNEISAMVAAKVPDEVILQWINTHAGELKVSPTDIATLQKANASKEILAALSQPDVYIGWSVITSQVIRDNFGRHVMDKFFAIDVAIANRSKDTVIINTLEFCHLNLRDVSQDPALVRGSLQKGDMTGRRTIIRGALVAISLVGTPAAPFFKNIAHQNNFHTGLAILNQFPVAFDDVVPETTLKYLENWDKDEVFKKGFVVPGGASSRGRIFIPIELIYPRDGPDWKLAKQGKYNPEDVKKQIGSVVVLGQKVERMSAQRFVQGPQ